MKHKKKVTFLLLSLFILVQFIGLFVVSYYNHNILPYGLSANATSGTGSLIFSTIMFFIVLLVILSFFLKKLDSRIFLRLWFFLIIVLSMAVFFNTVLYKIPFFEFISVFVALIFAYLKFYKNSFFIHNFTEMLIYPGVAIIFIKILHFYSLLVLLVIISLYDAWAVWRSGFMQKMAKYHINKLNIFPGFLLPSFSNNVKLKIRNMKKMGKMDKNVKMKVAMLGGGDVAFSIISMGVIYRASSVILPFGLPSFVGGLVPAIFSIAGATLGLSSLLFFGKSKKFYPAMPFISAGIFSSLIIYYIITLF